MYIGIGSNIDAEENLRRCAALLRAHWPAVRFASVYKTAARDVEAQEDFLNTVALLEANETAEELQKSLQGIEKQLRKNPPYPKGPRTIDLDMLLYGEEKIDEEELQIPHHRMLERRFVLEPLNELTNGKYQKFLENTLDQECVQQAIIL